MLVPSVQHMCKSEFESCTYNKRFTNPSVLFQEFNVNRTVHSLCTIHWSAEPNSSFYGDYMHLFGQIDRTWAITVDPAESS